MSNNDDDFEVDNLDDAGFDDYSKKGTFADAWKNNPAVKTGVILAGFAIVVGAIILFGGKEERLPTSQVAAPSDVSEAPGSSEISATMEQAIQDKNIETVEEAARTGGSALPIPTQPSKGALPLPVEEEGGEDPLERWRRMQEERIRQQEMLAQAQPPAPPAEQPVDTKTPAVNALSQSMASQMQAILQNQKIPPVQTKKITGVTFLENIQSKKMANLQQQQLLAQQTNMQEQVENIIVPAGTIEYGQLLIEANTDAPGPVVAQIVSGPLRGGRILGAFTSTDEYLILNFSAVVIDGIDYPVQAVAIDPDTTLPGVITEIDRRYFKRIILPMAAEFVTGLTEAISESGTTSVFISDSSVTQSTEDRDSDQEVASGIAEAGDRLGEILDEEADRTQPMLRVAAGTPIGILFVAPVTDSNIASR
jgi:intracellular multiplication protein IcmE